MLETESKIDIKIRKVCTLVRSIVECKEIDDLAQEDHSYKATKEELDRYRSNWSTQLNNSTFNGPMASQDYCKTAVALKNHLYRQPED